VHEIDPVRIDVGSYFTGDRVDDGCGARSQPVDGERRIEIEVQTLVHVAVLEPGEIERGLAQRLRGNPGVDRGRAARLRLVLDDRDAPTEVRGLCRAFLARRTGADDDQVELLDCHAAVCPSGPGGALLDGENDVGRLHDDRHCFSGHQSELIGGLFRDRRGHRRATVELDLDRGGDGTGLNADDGSRKLVSCAESHDVRPTRSRRLTPRPGGDSTPQP
jgi:hypothetical protein